MLQETVRQTTVLLENMQNKLTVVEDMCDTLLKIRSMLEDKEDLEEVEPIILDSTMMKKKLVQAIDMVCKVLMEVREVGSLLELTLERVGMEVEKLKASISCHLCGFKRRSTFFRIRFLQAIKVTSDLSTFSPNYQLVCF